MVYKLSTDFDNFAINKELDKEVFRDIQQHCLRVAKLSILIGEELKLSNKDMECLKQSAMLHDYGKYYIPKSILLKPTKLTSKEMLIMRKHAYYGSQIAKKMTNNEEVASNILYHHENYNGTGYYSVKGEFIPLISRIIKVADVYDALTSERPYREALETTTALLVMEDEKEHYDAVIYEIFKNIMIQDK